MSFDSRKFAGFCSEEGWPPPPPPTRARSPARTGPDPSLPNDGEWRGVGAGTSCHHEWRGAGVASQRGLAKQGTREGDCSAIKIRGVRWQKVMGKRKRGERLRITKAEEERGRGELGGEGGAGRESSGKQGARGARGAVKTSLTVSDKGQGADGKTCFGDVLV